MDISDGVGRGEMRDEPLAPIKDFHGIVLTSGEDEVAVRRMDLHAVHRPFVFAVVEVMFRLGGAI